MIQVEIDKGVYLECYHHILEDDEDIDIEFIWGGRDSGKSLFVAQRLVEKSMASDYFRCLLIKETHESIKDAQWQQIKDVAEDWGVDNLFKFNTSPLQVTCINGGTFLTRGMNQPGRIRSISNPSDAWVEEGNQISKEAFITLLTSLRSNYGRVKLWFTFNPESNVPDYSEFWLYEMFFKKYEPELSFTGEFVIKIGNEEIRLKYRSTHVTYHNNPYVTAQRKAIHESLQITNYYWYRVFTLGLWGNKLNDSPWAYAFDRRKHVGKTTISRKHPLILSWDFNRNPMACSVIQFYDNHIQVIETIKKANTGIDEMCQYILDKYPGFLYLVTGDYSGMTETSLFKEQVTHYTMIKKLLKLTDGQVRVKPNPRLEKNSTLVNTIFSYVKITMDEVGAKPLIFDCENVRRRADGTIQKENRDDPKQQADALDTFRYFCNIFLPDFKPTDEMIIELLKSVPAVPKIEMPGDVIEDAIFAIENKKQIICTKKEFEVIVRDGLLNRIDQWITAGQTEFATYGLAEIKRMDNYFP